MIASLRSEFRKMLSVRSTYYILGIILAILGFFGFFISGYRADKAALADPTKLAHDVTGAITLLAVVISIVGILLVTHEYRHNTIVYTLTAARSRSTVLWSKIITVSVFAVIMTILIGILAPATAALGVHFAGHHLVPQQLPVWDLFWRTVFMGWGFSMFAIILAFIIRNQIGVFVAVLLIPSTVENLLGLLLKNNVVYLPFSALSSVLDKVTTTPYPVISHQKAALIALAYILAGWVVAWVLFLRRDAN